MRAIKRALSSLVVLLILLCSSATAQHGSTYLGCFTLTRLLYLKGVEGIKGKAYTQSTIGTCFKECRNKGYSLSLVATDYRCWCAMATPPPLSKVDDADCQPGSSKGALVFYHYEGTHACRIQELDTNPSNFNTAAQSKASAVFDSLAQSLQLHANSSGPVRSVAKLSPQLYGQFEVSAKVSMHPGVITSIDVQEAGTSSPQAKSASVEDINWLFFNTTPAGGKNMLLGTANRPKSAAGVLGTLMKPPQYKPLAGMKQDENLGNTWVTYTVDWQKDRVSWAMNGVPLLTKWASSTAGAGQQGTVKAAGRRTLMSFDMAKQDQQQKQPQQQQQQKHLQQRKNAKSAAQQQQQQQRQPWSPPNKPAQLSFGIKWGPKFASTEQQQQYQLPSHSTFMEVRRIVCDKQRTRADKGPVVPTWFLLGPSWEDQQQQQQQQEEQPQEQNEQQEQAKTHSVHNGKDDTNSDHEGNVSHKMGTKPPGSGSKVRVHNTPHAKKAQQQEWKDSRPDSTVRQQQQQQQEADDSRDKSRAQPRPDRGELEADEFSDSSEDTDLEAVNRMQLSPEEVLYRFGGSDAADEVFLGDEGHDWLGHIQEQLWGTQQDLDYEQPGESVSPFDAAAREGTDASSQESDSGSAASRGAGSQGFAPVQSTAAGKWRWAMDDVFSRSGSSMEDMLARAEDEPDWPDEEAE